MSKILKTTFNVINESERNKSIAEEMGKYILINRKIILDVSVDRAWKTFLSFLKGEYSEAIEFLPSTSFEVVTRRIGKVTYFINDISFKKKTIELDYKLGIDEYNVVYKFINYFGTTTIKVKHIAMIGDYTWSMSATFGKYDYKTSYKEQVLKIQKGLEYYLENNKIMTNQEYAAIEKKFDEYISQKYNIVDLKKKLVDLLSKNELNKDEKKQIKKINKILKEVGFL